MTNEYKEWLQEQTFETLATDNYNVKLLLLAEQAKNKELEEENRLAKQLILHTLDDFGLSVYDWKSDQNEITTELLGFIAKNKKLVEALEDCKEIAKTLYITGSDFLPLATYYKDIINTADMALNEVNK